MKWEEHFKSQCLGSVTGSSSRIGTEDFQYSDVGLLSSEQRKVQDVNKVFCPQYLRKILDRGC